MNVSPSVLVRSPLSTRLQVACVVAAACLGLAYAGEGDHSGEGTSPQAPPAVPPTPQRAGATQDSSVIAAYLRAQGFDPLHQVLAQQDAYYAIYTENTTTDERHLLFLRVQLDSVVSLLDPIEVGFRGHPNETRWVGLRGEEIDGLLITYNNLFEGLIGTVIFELVSDTLRRIYVNPRDSCRPAELRDLDGDGNAELVSYVEDPLGGDDCTSNCHLDLWSQFYMMPEWIRIQRWNGEEWVTVEREFPAFYRELADTLQAIDRWLRGGPGSDRCSQAGWIRGEKRDYFARLAARALEVAAAR